MGRNPRVRNGSIACYGCPREKFGITHGIIRALEVEEGLRRGDKLSASKYRHVFQTGAPLEIDETIVLESDFLIVAPFFRNDDNHSVRCARAPDGGSSRVF